MAQDAGEDVLPGVLLHVVEPPGPVDGAGHVFANFHRLFDSVDNDAVLFVDVGDGGAVQRAVVGRLAAALGVEGGAVQRHQIPVFARLTGQDRGGERPHKGVGVV